MPVAVTVVITLALAFYTVGVWSERIRGRLQPWHLAMFVLGLISDTVGTWMMFEHAGGLTWNLHGLSGLLAIVLMFVHAVWAAVVLWRRDEAWLTCFHRFSVVVWLVPYVSPMFFALGGVSPAPVPQPSVASGPSAVPGIFSLCPTRILFGSAMQFASAIFM